jgi:biopolymer transport protein ExbD
MKCLLSVSLATLAVAANFALSDPGQSPELQKGVSVKMAVTSSATAMPEADNNNAWVVTVTEDGKLYFGTNEVTVDRLNEQMKVTPRNRDQNLYIKADSRTQFANVQKALQSAREALFDSPVLLTSQPTSAKPGVMVPPNGLQVLAGPEPPAGKVATVVELLHSGQQQPSLRINGDEISWSALEATLMRHFQKGDEKVILLKADSRLSFAQVVQVIDRCRATGAEVAIGEPTV